MLTAKDIKRITEAQIEAQKDNFYTKQEMDEKFDDINNKISGYYSKQEMDEKFSDVLTFSRIKELTDYQLEVYKDIFVTKEELKPLVVKVDLIYNAMDSMIKDNRAFRQEMASLNHRVTQTEHWIGKAGPKIGVPFER